MTNLAEREMPPYQYDSDIAVQELKNDWRLAAELGPPDHIIQSTKWDVPAKGQDLWWEPEVDTGITESRCIKAVETLPSAAAHGSTHHANSHFLTQNEDGEWETYGRLSEYAYGKLGEKVPGGATIHEKQGRMAANQTRELHHTT